MSKEATTVEKTYLGGGVYVFDDGIHFTVTSNAHGNDNVVYLDSGVLAALLDFVEKARGVRITVTKAEGQEAKGSGAI